MCFLHVFSKNGEIIIDCSHQFQIYKCLIQRCISCSLSKTKCSAMNNICSCFYCCNIVCNTQSSILMTMPIDFDITSVVASVFDDFFVYKIEKFFDPIWCNVPTGITNTNSTNSKFHCSLIDEFDIFWLWTRGVFRHKHDRYVVLNCKWNCFFHRRK